MGKAAVHKAEKFISWFSFVLLAAAIVAMLGMAALLKTAGERSEMLDRLENERGYCESAIAELSRGSDYLTSEIWNYAADGDPIHLQNFWHEVEVNRSRDKAIQKLLHMNLTEEERTHVMRAKACSDELIQGENHSMRLLAESNGLSEREMPARVREVVLDSREQAFSAVEKREAARSFLYGKEYAARKSMIRDMVNAFNADLSRRLEYETTSMMKANKAANRYSFMVVAVLLLLVLLLMLLYAKFMRRKNRELALALEKAEAASRAKSYFTSRMSHEIRTPLNAVLGYLHMAENSKDMEIQSDSIKKSRIAATNLLSIVNDVLDLSAIENGKMQLVSEPFSVSEMLKDMQVVYTSLAKEKDVRFQAMGENIIQDRLLGDHMRIHQVLTNLLSNALKFTSSGGSIQLRFVQELNNGTARMQYIVTDTGIGMGGDFLPHIFDAYEQEDVTIHQRFGGSGLGMSIVKSLVDKMGGTIEVQSEKGKGSAFTVCIESPLAAENSAEDDRAEEVTEIPAAADSLAGMHVLLAEDNAMNLEIAQAILAAAGVSVTAARNGREALELFERSEPGTFALILMDIIMPELNGYEATRQIRRSAHPDGARIPILAMSANAFASDIRQSLAAGMNGHLAKPIDIQALFSKLRQYYKGAEKI